MSSTEVAKSEVSILELREEQVFPEISSGGSFRYERREFRDMREIVRPRIEQSK